MFKNCKKIMMVSEMENRQNWLNIKDPAHLQPGQLIVIHVKPVKGGGKA